MAHIEDRWYKTTIVNGKKSRQKTGLHGRGHRYRVRFIDPSGKERSKSFKDKEKGDAEAFLVEIEHAKRSHTYVDPGAGNIRFRDYAEIWLRSRVMDPYTREGTKSRIANHMVPFFGDRPIKSNQPETINEWNRWMESKYAENTHAPSFQILKSIHAYAVDNKRIPSNPCSAKSVTVPRQRVPEIVPWPRMQVVAVRAGLGERYQAMVDLAAGCGPRQGEVFGVGEEDFDFDDEMLRIRRQVKRVGSRLVFGLPKSDKERSVPLPRSVAAAIKDHLSRLPPTKITLPWEDPHSDVMVTVPLIFTNARGAAITRGRFNDNHWVRALDHAGIPRGRQNGMHALRHYYASVLIDAGESIKRVAANLGHSDPSFTWRRYVHLIKGTEDRTRQAIDRLALADEDLDSGSPERPGDGLDAGPTA